MPKAWNKRDPNVPKDAVYVGRPTKWGNPYSHMPHTLAQIKVDTRDEAVAEYRTALLKIRDTDPSYYAAFIKPLRGKDLVCWCAPLPCHADVLLELANDNSTT